MKNCRGKFKYKLGDLYPGNHVGHRECLGSDRNVPAKMGWLWNDWTPCMGLKPRKGWCPGAVDRVVANKIIAHRKANELKLVEDLKGKCSKKSIQGKQRSRSTEPDDPVIHKPTLLIKKRDGCYLITVNPLKDPKQCEDNENPYMDCTPMQFKIDTNDSKRQENVKCFCGTEDESDSDNELEIEFTPPAGIVKPICIKRKNNVVHTDTQYVNEDFKSEENKRKSKCQDDGKMKKGKK